MIRENMKKLLLVGLIFVASSSHQMIGMSYAVNAVDFIVKRTYKVEEISVEKYPKACKYFDGLRVKYPDAFPENVKFVIAAVACPHAGASILMLPVLWIEQLETEIYEAQCVAEWVLLHEAGHIHCAHTVKGTVASTLVHVAIAVAVYKYCKSTYPDTFQGNWATGGLVYGSMAAGASIKTLGLLAYQRYMMEPQADDFANATCTNPDAMKFGMAWLDRCGIDVINYPTKASRIALMQKSMEEKLGVKEEDAAEQNLRS